MLSDKHVLILGIGKSGLAAAELAAANGARVTAIDQGDDDPLRERADRLSKRGAEIRLAWGDTERAPAADLAVISPGIAHDSVLGALARNVGCEIISELELGYRYCSCPILAVTGTNGKTTTVELLVHCLRTIGVNTMAAGNVGLPLSAIMKESATLDCAVVEVSSFQLEHVSRFQPLAAALLNVTPDHYDRHGSHEAYLAAKLRLFANMRDGGRIVLGGSLLDDPAVVEHMHRIGGRPLVFGEAGDSRADFVVSQEGTLVRRQPDGGKCSVLLGEDELRLPGRHNLQNLLAACALAEAAGYDPRAIAQAARSFVPQSHRLETVGRHDGVWFVNDSKATNPDALLQALQTIGPKISGKVWLLAGGVDKDVRFSMTTSALEKWTKGVFLMGNARNRMAEQWKPHVSCRTFQTLESAFDAAVEETSPGDAVLLSPGCASQDMFTDYAERGRMFCELVKRRYGE
ncbi:MAG: UDP-N-acetylmuramoyl-L-alanine--D-glutamate ligase [Lentisphaeria bacterium]|nr:UDP-N-acetylmuramoyl-L-alanine--D-glutamate ligase [Lentisphaeria bacterium]